MIFKENILLAPFTTFKIGGPATFFCVVESQLEALEAFEFAKQRNLHTFVLGGGSNILVSDDGFNGLVINVKNKGIEILQETEHEVLIKVASGEVWDEVVKFAINNQWWGIENLSHIPGSTGAIAVQNVGAYGQEASNVIESVMVFDSKSHQILTLDSSVCNFGYRTSIFNTTQKGKYIIFHLILRLKKTPQPNLEYKDLKLRFDGKIPNLIEIRKAVIEIRDKKFPFPTEAIKGNAGSFFKNPILSLPAYQDLTKIIRNDFGENILRTLESKKFEENYGVKIPAAFLIEICGLKAAKSGGAAINPNQPLVIINSTGSATAGDVLSLANLIKLSVLDKTGVELNFEPQLIGFR